MYLFLAPQVPLEPKSFQNGNSLFGHTGWLPFAIELILTSLTFYPDSHLTILGETTGDIAVSMYLPVLEKFFQFLIPACAVRIPDKANLFQGLNTLIRHGGSLALLL